jgi:pimeloyl-ACP methyl ester carboxylesterase
VFVTMSTPMRNPLWFGLPFPLLPLRLWGEWSSTADRSRGPQPPPGGGRPAVMIPGFLAGDPSLARMAVWLRDGDWTTVRSGITANTGCMEPTLAALEDRVAQAVHETGHKAVVIGQSRGGCLGRALAVLRPDLVSTLVTLGSPLRDQLAVHPHVLPSIVAITALGTFGMPGMLSLSCLRGDCCERPLDALEAPFPEGLRFVSIYSRSDEVVRWRACLDIDAEHVEVDVSHVGMGVALPVWAAIAAVLAG